MEQKSKREKRKSLQLANRHKIHDFAWKWKWMQKSIEDRQPLRCFVATFRVQIEFEIYPLYLVIFHFVGSDFLIFYFSTISYNLFSHK